MAPELSWIDSHCHRMPSNSMRTAIRLCWWPGRPGWPDWWCRRYRQTDLPRRAGGGRYPGCATALGLHPICTDRHQPDDLWRLRAALQRGGVVAVGEIGLDGLVPGLDMACKRHCWWRNCSWRPNSVCRYCCTFAGRRIGCSSTCVRFGCRGALPTHSMAACSKRRLLSSSVSGWVLAGR